MGNKDINLSKYASVSDADQYRLLGIHKTFDDDEEDAEDDGEIQVNQEGGADNEKKKKKRKRKKRKNKKQNVNEAQQVNHDDQQFQQNPLRLEMIKDSL